MKDLKFVLVGCGRIALRHAEQIKKYGTLVAACDIDKSKAEEFSRKFGCKTYPDIDSMLKAEKDIDVASICTPNGLHAEHTIKSLQAGLNVLCEKPMALDVNDCGRMIQEAEKANKRLFIVKQNRFNPPVQKVKKLLDEGKLGKLYSVQLNCFWNRNNDYYLKSDWKGKKSLDGGTLFTQFSHFIDLLYWMIGDIKEIYAFCDNSGHKDIIEIEDNGAVILKFYNGVIGTVNYTVNSYKKNMEGSITIFGEKGTVKIGGQYLNELDYCMIQDYELENMPQGNPPNVYENYVGSMANHDKVYENLLDVLLKGGSIVTNCYEGLKTVEIINRIYHSSQKLS